jgi:hypothetical protein
MRKILIGFVVVLAISTVLYVRFRRPSRPRELAYVGSRELTLWSTTAQVREPVAMVKYGEPLNVLGRFEDQVQVQTTSGSVGWINETDLLSADLWQRANDLEALAGKSPVEARGHTHGISNLHVDAGRESPRIRQLSKGLPVDLYERTVVSAAPSAAAGDGKSPSSSSSSDQAAPPVKKEDWWLVRAHLPDQTSVSGWILGRFVDLDVPPPLPDYASAAAMRIVAWFELNRVADRSTGSKPQYLLVGTRGPEGQPCDFTMMRVFTWGQQKQRYETAYVESNMCGKLPMNFKEPSAPEADVLFWFEDFRNGANEERKYRMERTVVRRINEGGSESSKRRHARG